MSLKKVKYDPVTNSLVQVPYEHYELHAGSMFTAHYVRTTANTDNHRTVIGFKTPNTTKWGHLTFTVSATHPADAYILEAPTVDDDAGSQITVFNRNRNSSNTSGMLELATTPTAMKLTSFDETEIAAANLSGGSEIDYTILGGGDGPRVIGGMQRGDEEWMLKQNTKYLVFLRNIGANANSHVIQLNWYEHTNKA